MALPFMDLLQQTSHLHIWTTSLLSFQSTHCFHCFHFSFFSLSLTRRSLLRCAGFLPPLPDFFFWEMESSCFQKSVLKELPVFFCSCVPKDSFPGDLIQQFLKQSEVLLSKVQGPDAAFCQAHILQDYKFNHVCYSLGCLQS